MNIDTDIDKEYVIPANIIKTVINEFPLEIQALKIYLEQLQQQGKNLTRKKFNKRKI